VKLKIGQKIYYEIESFGNIVRRKGVVVAEYPSFYVVEVVLPAHPRSFERVRRFLYHSSSSSNMSQEHYIPLSRRCRSRQLLHQLRSSW
jgi:hypothetical protein